MNIRYKVRVFKIQKDFLKDKVVSFEFGDKIVRSAGERLRSELYEKRRREEEIDSYIDSLRDEINSSYFNDAAYNYDLKIGNKYNLPAGYYSFDRPIDQDPTKVIYMGAGKMLVADKKNPDGSWKWGTMATGEGVVAESIVGTLGEFAKVNAYQINVNDEFADTALGKKVVVQGQLYNNVKITGTKGVQVLDNQNRERVQLGNWSAGRYGLKLTDASGNRTILDDNGILQSWQDGRCDNVDANNPLKLHIYIPKETQRIYKAALRIYTEGFRAYSKATEWKGTQSTSTKSGGGDYTSTGDGGGGYPSTEYAGDSAPTSHEPSDVEGGMYDYDVIGGGGGHVSIYKTTLHRHKVEIPSHSHRVEIPEHTHRVSIESHTHDVEIPGHKHDIIFGIYQEYASNVRTEIYINGTDRTAAISGSGYVYGNNDEMNLTAYLKNGWNEIEVKSNNRCRVDATIFIQALLNYGGY